MNLCIGDMAASPGDDIPCFIGDIAASFVDGK